MRGGDALTIVTIGKFEGIHLGHRALLETVVKRAKEKNLASVAVVFSPHPYKILHDANYKMLFSESERDFLIKKIGIEKIFSLEFNKNFAEMKAVDFCKKIFEELHAREIIVGQNYRFGYNREGTIETLRDAAAAHDATVHVIPQKNFDKNLISTSRIRELLAEKNFSETEKLLGFSFFIAGEVTKGRQLGRVLGFPTLNLYPPDEKFLPQNGVYETRTIIDGVTLHGITNIGIRPTVDNTQKISVETHLPNFSKRDEMYGREIKVEFIKFIRAEKKFASAEELQMQIKKDIQSGKENAK
jgi:riboflavin kinase/FMN adenylyltransferase